MKKILLLLVTISGTLSSFAQPAIANYSFEDWSARYKKTAPTGWEVDSFSIANNVVKKVTDGSDGLAAIQLGCINYLGEVVGSVIERNDSVTSTPGDLSFDYKVFNNVTKEFNGLSVAIYFKDANKMDCGDFNWSSQANNANYVKGSMPISFATGKVPKYYKLIISYYNLGGKDDEYTIIDNLKFAKGSGAVNKVETSAIKVYPNPALNVINFNDKASDKLSTARLVAIDGKVTEFAVTNSSIDVSALSNGIYMVELINTDGQLIKREKINILK